MSRADGAERLPKRRRIVVIDDNADAADTLADVVRLWGHEVAVAYDGLTGVVTTLSSAADVVLCDIGLPDIDGYEVAARLRVTCAEKILLVAVSGYARPEDVARSLGAGYDCHMAKPPDAALLRRIIEAY